MKLSTAALALALTAGAMPAAARAQTTMTVNCVSGIGCDQLQFNLTSGNALDLNQIQLTITGGTWRFTPANGPGTYVASDDFGAFGGFTTIDAAGESVFIDFLGASSPGFPFSLGAGSTGFFQFEGMGVPTGLIVSYRGNDGAVAGRVAFGDQGPVVTPEPASVVLLATGLAGIVLMGRRRRR